MKGKKNAKKDPAERYRTHDFRCDRLQHYPGEPRKAANQCVCHGKYKVLVRKQSTVLAKTACWKTFSGELTEKLSRAINPDFEGSTRNSCATEYGPLENSMLSRKTERTSSGERFLCSSTVSHGMKAFETTKSRRYTLKLLAFLENT